MGTGLRCWRCGASLREDLPGSMPRLEQCRACEADLHVCRQCRFYAPQYHTKCSHDFAEPPREVDLANFCQHFRAGRNAFRDQGRAADQARDELAALFGETPAPAASPQDDAEAAARERLRALFGDEDSHDG